MILASAAPAAGDDYTAQTRRSIRLAFTELKSGLRHNDGELACSRMSRPLRAQMLSVIARDTGTAGLGCVAAMSVYGRATYEEIRSVQIVSIAVRHTRARARSSSAGRMCFIRDGERWKLSVPTGCSGP